MELDVSTWAPRNSRTAWENSSAPSRAVELTPPKRSSTAKSACRARTRSSVSLPGNKAARLSRGNSGPARLAKIQKRTKTLCCGGEPRTRTAR